MFQSSPGNKKKKIIRVRIENGHNVFYKKLKEKKEILIQEISELKKSGKENKKESIGKKKIISIIDDKMKKLRELYHVKENCSFYAKRYSSNVSSKEHAIYVENLFKELRVYHSENIDMPKDLEKKFQLVDKAPVRSHYLHYLASTLIDLSGYKLELDINLILAVPEDIFKEQINIKEDYLQFHNILYSEILDAALDIVANPKNIELCGKKFIFTAAPASYTAIDCYFRLLYNLGKRHKVHGFIFVGPWSRTIFLHKRSETNTILQSVKDLVKKFKVYSLRSNLDVAEVIPDITALGVTFIDSIEDDKNLFLGYQLTHSSRKDQIKRYRDLDKDKNIFVFSSAVSFETTIYKDKIYNIIGSGSSSINLPRSRRTTTGYDSQFINSIKYDSTGGHLLTFDEFSDLHCSTFHYNRSLKSILINGEKIGLKSPLKPIKCFMSIIASDMHIQHMNKTCFKAFLYFLAKHRDFIKRFIINGDFFDNVVLSHWSKDKIKKQIEVSKVIPSFLHEVAYARKVLELIKEQLNPNTELIYKMGNHEINSLNKILEQPLLHSLSNLLNLETLLNLKNLGFKVIDSKVSYKICGLDIIHGHEMSPTKARERLGRNNASAHTHRCAVNNNGITFPGMQDSLTADYLSYFKQSWANGWGIVNEYDSVSEKPEFVLLTEKGIFNDFDSLRDANALADIDLAIPKEITIKYNLD